MKRIYTVLIALSSMVLGFGLSSFYSASIAPLPAPTTLSFNPNTSALRMLKGAKQTNDNYYLNVLLYASDSITVTGIDSFNTKSGLSIAYNGGNYLLTATHGTIDTIPRSVYTTTSYTFTDSTIYSRYGVIYGKDNTGKLSSFNISDIVSTSGGKGTVTYATVALETFE
jgi:hypothetical protein